MHSRFFRHVFLGLLPGLGSVAYQKKPVAGPAINRPPQPSATTFVNPLLASGPDPWVYQKDGFYYFLTTSGGDVRIRKSATPVFVKNPAAGAYGPGHNGFFKSRDGTENWLIYHANNQPNQGCGDVRNPRMQKFTWNSDNSPNFGQPLPINVPQARPAGE